mmetsp:Transcript_28135/g.46590  ORF Transcript_28135/g.46590 Transcript_28135/m.46590 type:complete len:162 (-) Transcript_28135:14-499(-)
MDSAAAAAADALGTLATGGGGAEEDGDGGSVSDGSECRGLDPAFLEAFRDQLTLADETVAVEENETLLLKEELSDNITLSSPPTDWTPPFIKVEKGEPFFESVDNNPGNWSKYNFHPDFEKKAAGGNCQGGTLPTGVTPPVSVSGPREKRTTGGWELIISF